MVNAKEGAIGDLERHKAWLGADFDFDLLESPTTKATPRAIPVRRTRSVVYVPVFVRCTCLHPYDQCVPQRNPLEVRKHSGTFPGERHDLHVLRRREHGGYLALLPGDGVDSEEVHAVLSLQHLCRPRQTERDAPSRGHHAVSLPVHLQLLRRPPEGRDPLVES